jgi:hypothetical protein
MSNLFSTAISQVYPATSVLSKTFLAVVMFISWLVGRKKIEGTKNAKKKELLLMALVGMSFIVFIGAFLYLTIIGVVVDSLMVIVVGLISLMLLILALLGYLIGKGWVYEDFNYWIIFLLSFLILSQIFYLPFFNLEYANMMNLSIWARFFAYIGLLIGFLNSIYGMFQKEVIIQKELASKNRQLDQTKAKVEEAYLMLREEKWSLARSKGSVDKILKDVMKKK